MKKSKKLKRKHAQNINMQLRKEEKSKGLRMYTNKSSISEAIRKMKIKMSVI